MMRKHWLLPSIAFLLYASTSLAAVQTQQQSALLQADTFTFDQKNEVFVAQGRVELEQEGQMVFADRMTYDRKNDQVMAEGNVVVVDKAGQVYFAQKVALQNKLKTGAVEQIGLVFPDGSRAAARQGAQTADNKTTLRDAVYSPCNLCNDDPHKPPLWQLRANKIVHDKNVKDVYYHGAKFDVYGKPVLYTPYFSHPDPSVKARSGLLMPNLSSDSKKGFMLRNYYYHTFSPYEDGTLEVSNTQKAGSLIGGEWRKRFSSGNLLFQGSLNRSTVRGGSDDNVIIKPEKWRGHIFANGIYNINQKWRTGFNARRTTDNYYLNDFDYGGYDVLTNNLYAERFSGRDYTSVNAYYFQDLRPNINQEQPNVLPWARQKIVGTPNKFLGGRWAMENETVTLLRSGGHSMSRLSAVPSWERRDIWPVGLQTSMNGKFRADGYWVRQNNPFNVTPDTEDETVSRFMPSAQIGSSYPLIKPGSTVDTLIEPKVALTIAPNATNDPSIPNEDSRDVQLDMSNLFNDTHFPGTDRLENGSHASYGVKVGGYMKNGNSAFATVGQSYRLTSGNPFPDGSGLERNRSDLVGQLEATFNDRFYTDYRFQLNEEDLDDRRHELQAAYIDDGFEARTNYIFAQRVQGTGLAADDRQQIGFSAAKALTSKWSIAGDTLNDLSGESGMLKAGGAIQYKNECLRISLRAERDLTDRQTGGSDSRILFSIGLRNLGGYDTPLLDDDPLYRPFNTERKI